MALASPLTLTLSQRERGTFDLWPFQLYLPIQRFLPGRFQAIDLNLDD